MMSKKDGCPRGTIKRRAYTARRQNKVVKVPASCIVATSARGVKRSDIDKSLIRKMERTQEEVNKKYGKLKCPSGQIERSGYRKKGFLRRGFVRKSGTYVEPTYVAAAEVGPTCITDLGTKGKGFKIPTVLEKGVLKNVGYSDVRNLTLKERRRALERANRQIKNPLSLFRKLVILSTMNKNKDRELSKIFRDDANYVKETFGLLRTRPKKDSKRSHKKVRSKSKENRKKSSRKIGMK